MQSLASRGLALKICVSGVQFSEVAKLSLFYRYFYKLFIIKHAGHIMIVAHVSLGDIGL